MKIDKDLINECIRKDRNAQKALYTILLPYLNPVCRRYLTNQSDVQDALQETFVNIFVNISKYDKARSMFQTWAVRIAINTSLKINKLMNREVITEEHLTTNDTIVHPEVMSKLSNADLMKFLKTMPTNYFEVFNLHLIDGYSHKEVAALLSISESLSRKRLSRARSWLKDKTKSNALAFLGIKKVL